MFLLTNLEKKSTLEELNDVESSYGGWPAVPVTGTPWVSKWGLLCQEIGCLALTLSAVNKHDGQVSSAPFILCLDQFFFLYAIPDIMWEGSSTQA